MMTKKVTDDDCFQNLSSSAQALYLHLTMSADDDGFCRQVNASMFKAHASIQDLEALLSARFLLQFESGVIVIKHWRMANALRKDRYTPTAFQEELSQLRLKENGSYTERSRLPNGCQMVAARLPQNSIDKDRVDKNRVDIASQREKKLFIPPTLEEVQAYIEERNSPVNAKRFFDYFTAGDWKDSAGKPVKNWKQKLITWESKQKESPQSGTNNIFLQIAEERGYDL